LERLHAQILANLDALEALTALAEPPHALSSVRLALTRASRARTMFLERLHADLIVRGDGSTRTALETLRAGGKAGLVTSANHIGAWTLREIASNWRGYCEASRAMRAAMRERIVREAELVYPLLAKAEPVA
jgi:hypothetical protein